MADLLKGAPVAAAITEDVAARAAALLAQGVTPTLAVVRVGEREDDLSYERAALRRCGKAGIAVKRFALPADCSQSDLMAVVAGVNADEGVHGCLMFRPLPSTLDEDAACEAIDPAKDVDGVTRESLATLISGQGAGFAPCTAEAVLALLDHYGVELEGARATVVGRSLVIGKPVAMMLQRRHATVTMCHTRTRDLAAECRRADVLVAAAGHAGAVAAEGISPGQVVVDVGINWDGGAGKLVGDVDFAAAEQVAAAVTPVPGGVGAVTTAVLARHVVEAAERMLER